MPHITQQNAILLMHLGIPYAKPPVGDLRFKKPEKFPAWQGIRQAKVLGNYCSQRYMFAGR